MKLKNNILAFLVIGITGALGHFVYKWSGNNPFLGLFFSVNESTWEHLKLLFFPALIYFAIEYLFIHEKPENFFPASITGIFCGMLSIIVLFYTISGVFGKNDDSINIIIYYISVIITIVKRNKIINDKIKYSKGNKLFIYFITALTTVLFIIWSYNPPELPLFVSPV